MYEHIHLCIQQFNEKGYHEYDKEKGVMESLEGSKRSQGNSETIYNFKS